jgi:hypothetical protein
LERTPPSQRRQVEALAAYGIPETHISRVVGIDPKTLRKCYRDELDLGETKANAHIAGFLFNSAKNGNVSAQIFWLKTRARWRETPVELKHSGEIAHKDLSQLSDEELHRMIVLLAADCGLAPIKTIESSVPRREETAEPSLPNGGGTLSLRPANPRRGN